MEILLLFLPLIASIISGFFGKFIGDRASELITSLLVSTSSILSLILFYKVTPVFNCVNLILLTHSIVLSAAPSTDII